MEVVQAAAAAGDGGERLNEPGQPRHHLEDHLRAPDAREHRLRPCPQLGQASGFRHRVKRRDVQLALIVDRDLSARVNPRGDLISPVESSGVTGEQLGRVLGQPERPQDRPLGVLPCLA